MPVIFYHAGFPAFSGGYVGVDVFFVISGYLITSILLFELEMSNFSILSFYERRARRILPALFVVVFACIPFAWLWMLPEELKAFSASLVAVVFFSSNILFWQETGYFATSAELKPLLHTWSLAVEEQYYLLFPILLLLFWRFGRFALLVLIIILALFSLAISEWGWRNAPGANFYLAPSRAWELLAGSICAFITLGHQQRSSNVLSTAGLALIAYSIFSFDRNTPFPSLYALAPVCGTALVILFGARGTWVARLLSTPPLIGVGLISYSAYLWHQPIFAFARMRSITEPTAGLMAALALLSFFLAWATWKWIEQPFRRRSVGWLSRQPEIFAASGIASVIILSFGVAGYLSDGFRGRFSIELLAYAQTAKAGHDYGTGCFFGMKNYPAHPIEGCLFRDADGRVDVMLIGDSHSLDVSEQLTKQMRQNGLSYYNISFMECPPFTNLVVFNGPARRPCNDHAELAYAYAAEEGISTIVLTARFPLYLSGQRFDNGEGGMEAGANIWGEVEGHANSAWNDPARRNRILMAYEQEIRELAARFNVVLVHPIPEAGWWVPGVAIKRALFAKDDLKVSTSYTRYLERSNEINRLFDKLSDELPTVHSARVHELFCNVSTGRCSNLDELGIYYSDDNHLSGYGATMVAAAVLETITQVQTDIASPAGDPGPK